VETDPNVELRICIKCGKSKPATSEYFYSPKSQKYRLDTGCKDCRVLEARTIRAQIKQVILDHYGNKCACCNEFRKEFLTVDHINGDGAEHRKILGKAQSRGTNFYRWIIRNNFPDNLRILCMNCNWSLGQLGYCPHTKE